MVPGGDGASARATVVAVDAIAVCRVLVISDFADDGRVSYCIYLVIRWRYGQCDFLYHLFKSAGGVGRTNGRSGLSSWAGCG